MITIDQLLESVDLDFEPRFVTRDMGKHIEFWSEKPKQGITSWGFDIEGTILCSFDGRLKLAEFEGKDWTECIYEVPRKTTGKIEKFVIENDRCGNVEWWDVVNKINELVNYVNALIESSNIHEKQIDELQMKIEPEKCAVNELKGGK